MIVLAGLAAWFAVSAAVAAAACWAMCRFKRAVPDIVDEIGQQGEAALLALTASPGRPAP